MLARAGGGVHQHHRRRQQVGLRRRARRCSPASGKNVIFTSNVMPEIGVLEVDAANAEDPRPVHLPHHRGQGHRSGEEHDRRRGHAHPAAVLEAAKLLADGSTPGEPGASANCCWSTWEAPPPTSTRWPRGRPPTARSASPGCPSPTPSGPSRATWGLYHNLDTLKAIAERDEVPAGFDEAVAAMCRRQQRAPRATTQTACHLLLSKVAVRSAVDRHVGSLEVVVTPNGEVIAAARQGPDSAGAGWSAPAGRCRSRPTRLRCSKAPCSSATVPTLLKPKAPEMLLDTHYVLFALGLLAQSEPATALRLMRKYVAPLRGARGPVAGGHDKE